MVRRKQDAASEGKNSNNNADNDWLHFLVSAFILKVCLILKTKCPVTSLLPLPQVVAVTLAAMVPPPRRSSAFSSLTV